MVRVVEEYACALLGLAVSQGTVEMALRETSRWLARDTVAPADEDNVGVLTDFFTYLKEKGQIDQLEAILQRFTELALEHLGPVEVEIISAAPLSHTQLESFQRKLIMRSARQVRISHRIDPALIAGVRIVAGGVVMDTSVKSQLTEMREKLYKGGVFYPWMQ